VRFFIQEIFMLRLEFDGLFRNTDSKCTSAGIMCYGWQILRGRRVIAHGHGTFARGENANSNIAEYLALVEGLEALLDMGVQHERVVVCGDAKSVIHQMQGLASVSSPAVKPLHNRATRLARHFSKLHWQWLPRKHNRGADLLSRHALKHLWNDPSQYEAILARLKNATKTGLANRLMDMGGLRVYQPA
jgi:ribonuclease HI